MEYFIWIYLTVLAATFAAIRHIAIIETKYWDWRASQRAIPVKPVVDYHNLTATFDRLNSALLKVAKTASDSAREISKIQSLFDTPYIKPASNSLSLEDIRAVYDALNSKRPDPDLKSKIVEHFTKIGRVDIADLFEKKGMPYSIYCAPNVYYEYGRKLQFMSVNVYPHQALEKNTIIFDWGTQLPFKR